MAPTDTTLLTVHLPSRLAEDLEILVANLGRSRSWMVTQALLAWISTGEEAGYMDKSEH
jgi:hypothetical protein